MPSTFDCSAEPEQVGRVLRDAQAILIGAGAGLSASAGLTYDGTRFLKFFSDFHEKYGIEDMYAGGFYPYATPEEYWAWWSRHILYNRYEAPVGKPYTDLYALVKDREYFVLTTNVDHRFQAAGFDKARLFYTQGDYGLFQCARACHAVTYDNETVVRQMVATQKDMRVPRRLIPRCPVCGGPMTVNLRIDHTFVEDRGWHVAYGRYQAFLNRFANKRLVLLELGVGWNTPSIIKYPFWRLSAQNPQATYVCINSGDAIIPPEIAPRSIVVRQDIGKALEVL